MSLTSRSNCGPAAGEMKTCFVEGCGRQVVARGMCRRCYNEHWEKGLLSQAPRVERRPEEQLTEHFDVRLKKAEASHLTRLARIRGQTFAAILRTAVTEYLEKYPLEMGGTNPPPPNPLAR